MATAKAPTKAPEQDVLSRVKEAFGYSLTDAELVDYLLETWREEAKDCLLDEVFGIFIARSVHWTAEALPGRRPEEVAREAQCARLARAVPETPLAPESAELVARHFCGLLSLRGEQAGEHWLVDVNAKGKGPAPIYQWKPSGFPEGAVFDGVADFSSWRKLVEKLEDAQAEENPAGMRRLGVELRKTFPRAFALDFQRLKNFGLLSPELRTPVPDPSFSDEAGTRLWAAYRAFLPIGRVLLARASGERRAKLTAAEVKAATAAATGNDDAWPPALLLRLLAAALSGAKPAATTSARKILKDKSGVPLTRRWASLVAEQKGPFAP